MLQYFYLRNKKNEMMYKINAVYSDQYSKFRITVFLFIFSIAR